MFKHLIGLFLLFFGPAACAKAQEQPLPLKTQLVEAFGFSENSLLAGDIPVIYYQKGATPRDAKRLIVYLQGSDPSSQFYYSKHNDSLRVGSWIPEDYLAINPKDLYVVIEKPGFEGVFPEEITKVPALYHKMNSLDDRVMRANSVINAITSQGNFTSVIVYGHSEGAPVGAKLATLNPHITHLGFWAGNALPDMFDFALMGRQEVHAGRMSASEAQISINEMMDNFEHTIASDRENTEVDKFGYTNKRWFSYAEPPLNNLLMLDIPIFVQVATDDKSAPIDSTYLIPLEFARLGKNNLTYRVCMGCDHGFVVTHEDGTTTKKWREIFREFLTWSETSL